jgi:mannose-6-phosphate isomerase-like protein (cupin superfamily)
MSGTSSVPVGLRATKKNYLLTQLNEVGPVPCPCGFARRGFAVPENTTATIHLVDITTDARTHYHKKLTEIYLILEGTGFMELDGERVPVKPMTSILIQPGCRHRLIGKFKIINVPIPAFDPEDEWFD